MHTHVVILDLDLEFVSKRNIEMIDAKLSVVNDTIVLHNQYSTHHTHPITIWKDIQIDPITISGKNVCGIFSHKDGMLMVYYNGDVELYQSETNRKIVIEIGKMTISVIPKIYVAGDCLCKAYDTHPTQIWNISTGQHITIQGLKFIVEVMIIHKNILWLGSCDGIIERWNINTKKCVQTIHHYKSGTRITNRIRSMTEWKNGICVGLVSKTIIIYNSHGINISEFNVTYTPMNILVHNTDLYIDTFLGNIELYKGIIPTVPTGPLSLMELCCLKIVQYKIVPKANTLPETLVQLLEQY